MRLAPVASQPEGPCTTLVSAASRWFASSWEPNWPGLVTSDQVLPVRRQIAGYPSALPTASCTPPACAVALTDSSGLPAPGSVTGWTLSAVAFTKTPC